MKKKKRNESLRRHPLALYSEKWYKLGITFHFYRLVLHKLFGNLRLVTLCSKNWRQYVPRPHQHDYTLTDIIMKSVRYLYFFGVALKPVYFQILRIMLSLLRMKECLRKRRIIWIIYLGMKMEKYKIQMKFGNHQKLICKVQTKMFNKNKKCTHKK